MVRMLLVVFFIGLVISIGCSATVAALGGAHNSRWEPGWVNDDRGRRSWGWSNPGYDDPGASATRELTWSGGDRLQIDVPAEVNYTQGPQTKVTASGGQHELDDLVVEGDRIRFGHRHHWNSDSTLTLTITAPSVQQFQLNGAQKLDIANYAQDSLDLEINGAGQVNAKGSAKDLRMELNGAGQGNLGELANQTSKVEINGAGEATLATTDAATIEINGVGHARYLNTPKTLNQHKNGFGSVETGVGPTDAPVPQTPPSAKTKPSAAIPPKTHGKAEPV